MSRKTVIRMLVVLFLVIAATAGTAPAEAWTADGVPGFADGPGPKAATGEQTAAIDPDGLTAPGPDVTWDWLKHVIHYVLGSFVL